MTEPTHDPQQDYIASLAHQQAVNENAALRVSLEQLGHEYSQLKEAYDAKENGVPIGPLVGSQTIINQQREIIKLKAQLQQAVTEIQRLHDDANEREIFFAEVANEDERTRVEQRDKLNKQLQQAVEALKAIANMNQDNLRTQLDTGDTLRIAGATAKMFNDCRDIATAFLDDCILDKPKVI